MSCFYIFLLGIRRAIRVKVKGQAQTPVKDQGQGQMFGAEWLIVEIQYSTPKKTDETQF